jgi:hypothetical protein
VSVLIAAHFYDKLCGDSLGDQLKFPVRSGAGQLKWQTWSLWENAPLYLPHLYIELLLARMCRHARLPPVIPRVPGEHQSLHGAMHARGFAGGQYGQ